MARSSRRHEIYPISVREITVKEIIDINPGMRRIVFTGEGLKEHTRDGVVMPAVISHGFDDDVRIIFPDPVSGARPYPKPIGDGRLEWAEVAQLFRTYTVRRFDAEKEELVIDFARHGKGLAEDWSGQATVGDSVFIAGPKHCASLPVHRDWLLLAGDETAIPAISRCLEELPAGTKVTVVVEVGQRDRIQNLVTEADADIHWEVAAEGGNYVEKVCTIKWPQGKPFVWVAGESGRLKEIRRFVKEKDIDRSDVEITGYWRASGDGEGTPALLRTLHDMVELGPAFALRTAVAKGLFPLIDDGATAPKDLAKAAGVDEDSLVRLLRYLESLNLVDLTVTDPGDGFGDTVTRVELTVLSKEFADPESMGARLVSGPAALASSSMMRLEEAVTTGREVALGTGTRTFADLLGGSPRFAQERVDGENTSAGWTAPAFAAGSFFTAALQSAAGHRVAVVGPGAAVFADELLVAHPTLSVTVLSRPLPGTSAVKELSLIAETNRERADLVTWSPGQPAGDDTAVTVVLDPFGMVPGADVPELIAGLGVDTIIVVTSLLSESGAEDEDYETDLQRLCLMGTKLPTRRDLARAVAQAGFVVSSSTPVGWGQHAVTVRRA